MGWVTLGGWGCKGNKERIRDFRIFSLGLERFTNIEAVWSDIEAHKQDEGFTPGVSESLCHSDDLQRLCDNYSLVAKWTKLWSGQNLVEIDKLAI